jgi:hypothetical protein
MTARLHAALASVLTVVAIQLVLLTVAVESFWRDQTGVLLASTLASAVCAAGAACLVRYILPRRNHASD